MAIKDKRIIKEQALLVVGQRQKSKPIAWILNGSHALCILKTDDLSIRLAAQYISLKKLQ